MRSSRRSSVTGHLRQPQGYFHADRVPFEFDPLTLQPIPLLMPQMRAARIHGQTPIGSHNAPPRQVRRTGSHPLPHDDAAHRPREGAAEQPVRTHTPLRNASHKRVQFPTPLAVDHVSAPEPDRRRRCARGWTRGSPPRPRTNESDRRHRMPTRLRAPCPRQSGGCRRPAPSPTSRRDA